jgi:hypothetical protein
MSCYANVVLALGLILGFSLLLVLPQLAGLLVMRLAPRASWLAWPAAAISVFGVVFYCFLWAPTRQAEQMHGCGMQSLALAILLVVGLVVHLATGVIFGMLARRIRRRRAGT